MTESIEQFNYCMNICPYHNRYDGWCNYYYQDLGEIEISECDVIYNKLNKGRDDLK